MPEIVKLSAVMEAMDLPQEWESFLDPDTGDVVWVTEEDRYVMDREDDDVVDLPEWQTESVETIRRVVDSGRALRLPDAYDLHEWDLMRRFSSSIEDPDQRDGLLTSIHGKGAFRLFKMTVGRLGLREEWFRYRDAAVRRIAIDWLEGNGIEYVDDAKAEAT